MEQLLQPPPEAPPWLQLELWREDAVAQVSHCMEQVPGALIGCWRWWWLHIWEMYPSLKVELPSEGGIGGGGQTV